MNEVDMARLAGIGGGPQQQSPPQPFNPNDLDPKEFSDEPCKCGNSYFYMVFKVKKLSRLNQLNPTGQDIRSLQQVLICTKCSAEIPQ